MPRYYGDQPLSQSNKDDFAESILFENGDFLVIEHDSPNNVGDIYNLSDLCGDENIRDIVFYDDYLGSRNYGDWFYSGGQAAYSDHIFIISATKCYDWQVGADISNTFGDTGQVGEIIVNAVDADIDTNANIYVLDSGDASVKKFSATGTHLLTWYIDEDVKRIKLFDDKVFILDSGNDRILKFSKEGVYLGLAIESGNFHNITAFAPASTDYFVVADMNGRRLVVIRADGTIDDEKYGCCFYDVEFDFLEINDIYATGNAESDGVISLLDRGTKNIINLATEDLFLLPW